MTALATLQNHPSSISSTRPCNPLITKAESVLGGEITRVTAYSKIFDAGAMARLIEAIDADSKPATRDDVTSLSAMLLAKSGIWKPNNGTPESKDFAIYVLGLAEAFAQFPASIGWEAIHGGKGILAKLEFKPKPIDIVKFCTALMQKRANAKVMAGRHIEESNRRAAERRDKETQPPIDYEARKRRTEEIMKTFRAQSMDLAS